MCVAAFLCAYVQTLGQWLLLHNLQADGIHDAELDDGLPHRREAVPRQGADQRLLRAEQGEADDIQPVPVANVGDERALPVYQRFASKVSPSMTAMVQEAVAAYDATVADYRQTVDDLMSSLTPENHDLAVEIASLPEHIRGFGPVKARHLEEVAAREAALSEAWRSGAKKAPQPMAAE